MNSSTPSDDAASPSLIALYLISSAAVPFANLAAILLANFSALLSRSPLPVEFLIIFEVLHIFSVPILIPAFVNPVPH